MGVNCLELYLHISYTSSEMVTYLDVWLSIASFSYIDYTYGNTGMSFFTLFFKSGS
jgi:hypothetical protein